MINKFTFFKTANLLLIVGFGLLTNACELFDDDEPIIYDPPTIISPTQNFSYYFGQKVEIKWQVPDSTHTIEMQLLSSEDPDYFNNKHLFDTLSRSTFHVNQSTHSFDHGNNLDETIYYGFRLKYLATNGESPWSEIHYFKFVPLIKMISKELTVEARFEFISEETENYYSGLVESLDEIDLSSLLIKLNYDTSQLIFIKPQFGTIIEYGDFANHIDRFAFGFTEDNQGAVPIDIWGEVYGIDVNNEVTFSPFGGIYRDLYSEIGNIKTRMKAAYFLSGMFDAGEIIGKNHTIEVTLNLNCYFVQ